jgi:putative oxidoreductase
VLIVRLLVGLPFVAGSVLFFLNIVPEAPELPEHAKSFAGALMPTGYMNVVKVLELVGGLLLWSGRLTPLGIVILMPIAVNIMLFDFLLVGKPGLGVVIVALLVFLMTQYRRHFLPFFVPDAKIGG